MARKYSSRRRNESSYYNGNEPFNYDNRNGASYYNSRDSFNDLNLNGSDAPYYNNFDSRNGNSYYRNSFDDVNRNSNGAPYYRDENSSSYRNGNGVSYSHNRNEYNDEMRNDKGMPSVAQRYRGGMQGEGHYSGMEDRLNQEAVDGSMIREDHFAVANLPQNVIMRPYRRGGYGIPEGVNDTIEGVDRQLAYDNREMDKHMYPKKV